MLTTRRSATTSGARLPAPGALQRSENWGLIVYDEVHLLPAPVFRITAEIQARRRLGLTATLVREDGREDDVFSLIGPKKYDVPWQDLERQGWIADGDLHRGPRADADERRAWTTPCADAAEKYRIAATNPLKLQVVGRCWQRHRDDKVLVIGQYLEQLDQLAQAARRAADHRQDAEPRAREALRRSSGAARSKLLVVSKVANFSIDLPDANVAIQVSGTFGSRQEEAQRLGRILRPKADGGQAHFYSRRHAATRATRTSPPTASSS